MSQTLPPTPDRTTDHRGTVVVLSSLYWGSPWQPAQQLAAEFANRGFKVYFVHPLSGRWRTRSSSVLRRAINRLTNPEANYPEGIKHPIADGIEIVRPAGIPDQYWPARLFNRRVAIPQLAKELQQRGLPRPVITINLFPLPHTLALQKALAPDVSIYHAIWDFAHAPGGDSIQWNEPELVSSVDLIFADSPANINRMRTLSDQVITMPHGVDTAMFERAHTGSRPDPDHIRCAYFGSIDRRIDLTLLREVSQRYKLRLIGPASVDLGGFADGTEICGPVLPAELPGLLCDVDVLLLPYVSGKYIDAILPAKTFECLATGKPIVSIGLSSLEQFREYFYLCDSYQEVIAAIDAAAREDPAQAERRIALARENSWDRRIDQMIWHIDQVLAERPHQQSSMAP